MRTYMHEAFASYQTSIQLYIQPAIIAPNSVMTNWFSWLYIYVLYEI